VKPESIEYIVSLRVYKCVCGFIGEEKTALEHQVICDNPMELLT